MRLLYVADRQVDAYLVSALRQAGHVVEPALGAADGAEMAAGGDYGAAVLDWTGAARDDVGRFAAALPDALIVVVAAGADDTERTAALKAGADVCIERPASFIEIETRLQALARLVERTRPIHVRPALQLVASTRRLRVNGCEAPLSPQEYRLAQHLVAHAGEVISLDRLGQQVWGDAAEARPDQVRTSILRLRRKLAAANADSLLRTVPGHGYVLDVAALGGRMGAAGRA